MKPLFVCLLFFAFGAGPDAAAQDAAKPLRIIMHLPVGSTADTVIRIVAQPLSQSLGRPVIIEHKLGADGAIAAEQAARVAPDGHTLLYAGNTAMLGVPTLRKNPPYDPVRDFTPITQLVRFGFFLVVHPSVPANSARELVEYARAHPGALNYASGNINGILAGAQLMALSGVKMVHVPYKGEPLAVPDLIEARVHLMFATGGVAAPLVREGKLRALATLLRSRSPLLPGVPTVAEAGMPELSVVIWAGLFGPAKLPPELAGRMSREINAILKRSEVREQLERQGVEPAGSSPEEFDAFVRQQLVAWGKAAREAGLTPD